MIGDTFLMELRTGWKSTLIISILAFLVAISMTQLFPTFRDSLTESLEGEENVHIEIPDRAGDMATLSWEPHPGAEFYIVLEANSTARLITSMPVYIGTLESYSFPYDPDRPMYYAVLAAVNVSSSSGASRGGFPETSWTWTRSEPLPGMDMTMLGEDHEMELVGMATTVQGGSLFDEMLEHPAYTAFTGGRTDLDFTELKGFISIELFSWWWMVAGFFIAYYSVAVVAGDFEGKRMDLIFSTPLSRERYIVEKFLSVSAIYIIMTFFGTLGLMAGIEALEMTDELDHFTSLASMMSGISFGMVIISVGILAAVIFRSSKAAMGVNFGFVFLSFVVYTVAGISKSLEWLKYISIHQYWDYNSMLLDGVFNTGYFLGLLLASLVFTGAAVILFRRMDIPA